MAGHGNRWANALVGTAALGAAGLAYSYAETKLFVTRRVTVPVLAPGAAPIRILHISDLHLVPSQHRKLRWLASLADLKPDLVVNTGDNWGSAEALVPLILAFGDLLNRPGAFVFGSNDYYAPFFGNPLRYLRGPSQAREENVELPWQQLAEVFSQNWFDADNRRSTVTLPDGRTIDVVGTGDAHLDRDHFPPQADSAPITSGLTGSETGTTPASPQAPALKLGVTHAPYRRVLQEMSDDGVQLVLAGHTHGGQLRIPGFGALVTNSDLDRSRARGLHGWPGPRPALPDGFDRRAQRWLNHPEGAAPAPDGANATTPADAAAQRRPPNRRSIWLHVSAGAGTSPYAPFRFACRPEATLLTLVAVDANLNEEGHQEAKRDADPNHPQRGPLELEDQ